MSYFDVVKELLSTRQTSVKKVFDAEGNLIRIEETDAPHSLTAINGLLKTLATLEKAVEDNVEEASILDRLKEAMDNDED